MDTTNFLAQFLGMFFLIFGAAVLVNRKRTREIATEVLKTPALMHLAGLINVLFGLIILLNHNIWEMSWRTVISVVGCFMTLKGILLLLAPTSIENFTRSMVKKEAYRFGAVLLILLGAYLYYKGFFCVSTW